MNGLLRRALFQVHLWTGLLAGIYIVVVAVTGSALVFRIDLQRATYPALFTPGPEPHLDAVALMERVRDAYPHYRLSGYDAPTTSRRTVLAYVTQGGRFLTLLVDPASGRVLGELPERGAVRWLQELHFNLLAGRTGRTVNGIGGAALLLMALTGIVIWWSGTPGLRRTFLVDLRRTGRRITWDLHSAIGIWMLVFIAIFAVTGIYFAFPRGFRTVVNSLSPVTDVRAPSSTPPPGQAPRDWGSLVAIARAQAPGQHIARVVLPSADRGAFLVMLSRETPYPAGSAGLTSVYLDQFSGEVLQEPPRGRRTAGDVIMAWVAPLHVGNFGGTWIRVVWATAGLAPAILFVTGAMMWWTRLVRPRIARTGR